MRDLFHHLFVWALATSINFLIGWASVSFIWIDEATWPLSTNGSRAWFVFSGLLIAGLMTTDGYRK